MLRFDSYETVDRTVMRLKRTSSSNKSAIIMFARQVWPSLANEIHYLINNSNYPNPIDDSNYPKKQVNNYNLAAGWVSVRKSCSSRAFVFPSFLGAFRLQALSFSKKCKDPRLLAWRMLCAAYFSACISLSRATPSGRSHYQRSEFPTELLAHQRSKALKWTSRGA